MSDNTNTNTVKENGSKARYARYSDIPHTCNTCNNLIVERDTGHRVCLYNIMDRVVDKTDDTWYELPDNVNGCQHWVTEEVCGDCKYAINPRIHSEEVGYVTYRCSCYHTTKIDIDTACKRFRVKGGDMKT